MTLKNRIFARLASFFADEAERTGVSKADKESVSVILKRPDDMESLESKIEDETIEKAFRDTREIGHPYAGIISRGMMAPFPIITPGRFDLVAKIDDVEMVCCALRVNLSPDPESA